MDNISYYIIATKYIINICLSQVSKIIRSIHISILINRNQLSVCGNGKIQKFIKVNRS